MLNVLLIENNELDVFIATRAIELSGVPADVHHVHDGVEALRHLTGLTAQNQPLPDMILVDLHMPRLSGEKFLEAFAKLHLPGSEGVRVVVFSALDPARMQSKFASLGVSHFMEKPLLVETIGRMLHELNTPGQPTDNN